MQIDFLGGAQTVTGSQHLLSINGKKILLECGLFQGRRGETYEKNLNFSYDPSDIEVMLLSHAHIDHSGNIPNLVKSGFGGRIISTMATVDLCQIMLRDSAYLQEKDVEWVNKVRASKHEPLIEPLYTIEDAEAALQVFVGVQYDKPFTVAPGVTATFQEAGHILGSSGILLEIDEDGRRLRFGFSGDIGRPDMPILRDPRPIEDLDALIMESTYGDRSHDDSADCEEELAKVVRHVVNRGGKLIIPAFAVGRTQMLTYMLHLLLEQKRIPKIPVYVDSPMACNAFDVFRAHPECFDRETYHHYLHDKTDPLMPEGFACVRATEASKRLNHINEPQIIIAASGMAEGGRILHHLRNNVHEKRNMVLFVGFAARHTLARRLMDGKKKVRIFGDQYEVKCEVKTMPYFSGHADRKGLLDYLDGQSTERLKNVFLVHGEVSQAEALQAGIREKGFTNVHIPAPGDTHTV
jgi:metallo-beta-lactamase family protein